MEVGLEVELEAEFLVFEAELALKLEVESEVKSEVQLLHLELVQEWLANEWAHECSEEVDTVLGIRTSLRNKKVAVAGRICLRLRIATSYCHNYHHRNEE